VLQERYWLIAQSSRPRIEGEFHSWDFVSSEDLVGKETVIALEVFTSQEAAEAAKRSMDRLASDAYLDAVNQEPSEVFSLSRSELVSMLDGSGLMYVVVDPLPVDQRHHENLQIRLAWEFAEELRDG
jgi:hypothetical protein